MKDSFIEEKLKEMKEKLADIEHQRWADWQKYMHSKILPSADDGIMQIGEEFIKRWERQIKTPYSELSEIEKESDREQVDRYLPLITNLLKVEKEQFRESILKALPKESKQEPFADRNLKIWTKGFNQALQEITKIIKNTR